MAENEFRSSTSRTASVLGLLLLAGSIGGVAYWLKRPPAPARDPLDPVVDVFCSGRVDVEAHVIPLEPTVAGRVVKVSVEEGDKVKAGQELLAIDPTEADARVAQAEAAVEAARVELDAAANEKERFPLQLSARASMTEAAAARVEAARKFLEQRREQKQVTPLGRAEEEAMNAQVRELELMLKAEKDRTEEAKRLDPELRVRAARVKLAATEADLRTARRGRAECTLVAPKNGVILRFQASVGGMVGPGSPTPVAMFAPESPMIVRAEVDQESLDRVGTGMKVEFQDENRSDGALWTGKVKRIARWIAPRRTHVLEPGEISDVRTLECVVELDKPDDEHLRIGQRMRVRILRDSKPR